MVKVTYDLVWYEPVCWVFGKLPVRMVKGVRYEFVWWMGWGMILYDGREGTNSYSEIASTNLYDWRSTEIEYVWGELVWCEFSQPKKLWEVNWWKNQRHTDICHLLINFQCQRWKLVREAMRHKGKHTVTETWVKNPGMTEKNLAIACIKDTNQYQAGKRQK